MNINLISPTDNTIVNKDDKLNGHRYTVRFKQDILIPRNSKIQLNFATLERQSEIQFINDQTLYIHFPRTISYITPNGVSQLQNIYPSNKTDNAMAVNDDNVSANFGGGNRYSFTVPKGFYTFERLYAFLSRNFNDYLQYSDPTTAPPTPTGNDNSLYRGIEITDTNPTYDPDTRSLNRGYDLTGEGSMSVGIVRNLSGSSDANPYAEQPFTFDFEITPAHSTNVDTKEDAAAVDGTAALRKTNATLLDASTPAQTDAKVYDAYALATHGYNHLCMDDDTPLGETNIISVETLKTGDEISADRAGMCFGLYSREVAEGIAETEGAYPLNEAYRTTGNVNNRTAGDGATHFFVPKQSKYNIATADGLTVVNNNVGGEKKIPVAFITVRISAEGDHVGNGAGNLYCQVFRGKSSSAGGMGVMRSCHDHLQGTDANLAGANNVFMSGFKKIRLDRRAGYDGTEAIKLGLQVFQDPNEKAQNLRGADDTDTAVNRSTGAKHYFRVVDLSNADYTKSINAQPGIVLFDSRRKKVTDSIGDGWLNNQFFFCQNNASLNYTTPAGAGAPAIASRINKIKSQQCLTPILWVNTINHGFKTCKFRAIPKSAIGAIDYNARPLTQYKYYYLSATEELASTFQLMNERESSKIIKVEPIKMIQPNTSIPSKTTTYKDISLGWRSKSYSIFLKGLPLNNYKNTDSKSNGGFSKQILANVPIPFKDALDHYNIKTTGLYEPNTPIQSHLYNQDLVVNKFEVDIKRMGDDMDATEIEKSIVNFTIIPPDDYMGNLNAVQGYKTLPKSIIPKL